MLACRVAPRPQTARSGSPPLCRVARARPRPFPPLPGHVHGGADHHRSPHACVTPGLAPGLGPPWSTGRHRGPRLLCPLSPSACHHHQPPGNMRGWARHLPRQGAHEARVEPPHAPRRRVYAPLPATRPAQGVHHSPLLRPPEPEPSPSARAEPGAPDGLPQPSPGCAARRQPGTVRDPSSPDGGPALPDRRWAPRLPVPSSAPEQQAACMQKSGDRPHEWESLGRGGSTRRVRPYRHCLRGLLVPVHATPGEACLHPWRPAAYAPRPGNVETGLQSLALAWRSAGTALLDASAALLSPCKSTWPSAPPQACSTQNCVAAPRHTNA